MKRYLGQIRLLRIKVEQIKSELLMIRLEAVGKGIAYDKERVQSSGDNDPMFAYVAKIEERERKLYNMLDELHETRRTIIDEIQSMTDERYMQVLFKRYVEEKSFEQIAVEMGYDYTWTCKLHGMALKAFKQDKERQEAS